MISTSRFFSIYLIKVVLISTLLSACTSKQPEGIAKRYWDAVLAGDMETLQQVTTERSADILSTIRTPDQGSKVDFGRAHAIDDHRTEIDTTVTLKQGDEVSTVEIKTVLLKENDLWKVDVRQTRRDLYAALLDDAFADFGQSLEKGALAIEGALEELGRELAADLNSEIIKASQELRQQAELANEAIQETLEEIEEELTTDTQK